MQNRLFALAFGAVALTASVAAAAETPKAPEPAPAPVKIKRTEIIAADNWTVTCTLADQPEAKRRCTAELRLAQTDKNNAQRVVFTWVLALQNGKPTSAISIPPGVLIGPGVQVKIGDKESRTDNFALCQPDHCEAIIPLDDATLKAMTAAANVDFSVVAVNGEAVKFSASMKGFDEALGYVTK